MDNLPLKKNIYSIRRHPSLIKDIFRAKKWDYIEDKATRLDEEETFDFISHLKQTSPYYINPNDEPKLNRLCYVEDWKNIEIKNIISELQTVSLSDYIHRRDWEMNTNIINMRKPGFIHRKDWEWALGIVAMRRFGKLTKNSKAIGVGAGREEVLFYLANNINHVYATDLYDAKDWKILPHQIFLKVQGSMHLFHIKKVP